MNVTEAQVLKAKDKNADPWALGNQVLYDLCARFPNHNNAAEIVAKVWLIGESYSAALDRGRSKGPHRDLSRDEFYTAAVPATMSHLEIDGPLRKLRKRGASAWDNAKSVLELHGQLTKAFCELTGKSHRSLASKYLHFHCPYVFYIYDSRAAAAARRMMPRRRAGPAFVYGDPEYAAFASRAVALNENIWESHGMRLTPRELDRLLLAKHAALAPDVLRR